MNLVVCLDGTWNRPDAEYPTNVVKLARNLVNDFSTQIVYYDTGVGTGGKVDQIIGGATGLGIKENLEQAYRFLVENYSAGDQIYLFGFSRGSYTARSLGGLIYKCGLLKRECACEIERALGCYLDSRHPDTKNITLFRDKHSATRQVYFIGVWDTVGALGIPAGFIGKKISQWRNEFHDTKINPLVRHAYHAIALDEQREAFEPTLWSQSDKAVASQIVEQVWFPGVHSDVGGGYEDSSLSDLALAWMQDKAEAAGLAFKQEPPYVPRGNPLGRIHDSSRDWPLPTARREVNVTCDGLVFDCSVKERISGDPTYQPGNLLKGDRAALLNALPVNR
jgi:uncharacterized protein (DUF2235 family)